MSGEKDLNKLLRDMSPVLDLDEYVFATTVQPASYKHLKPIMRFTEAEGETLILKLQDAPDDGLVCSQPYCRITLNVHSALDAVGFLAAVCTRLAKEGISTNAVAAYYHDHIFVQADRAKDAMDALSALSTSRG